MCLGNTSLFHSDIVDLILSCVYRLCKQLNITFATRSMLLYRSKAIFVLQVTYAAYLLLSSTHLLFRSCTLTRKGSIPRSLCQQSQVRSTTSDWTPGSLLILLVPLLSLTIDMSLSSMKEISLFTVLDLDRDLVAAFWINRISKHPCMMRSQLLWYLYFKLFPG